MTAESDSESDSLMMGRMMMLCLHDSAMFCVTEMIVTVQVRLLGDYGS